MSTSSRTGGKAAQKSTRSPRKSARASSGSATRKAPRRSKSATSKKSTESHAKPGAKRAATKPKKPTSSKPVDVEVDPDVLEFIEAIDRFKREHGRPFPTWSEVLWIVRSLGYEKC